MRHSISVVFVELSDLWQGRAYRLPGGHHNMRDALFADKVLQIRQAPHGRREMRLAREKRQLNCLLYGDGSTSSSSKVARKAENKLACVTPRTPKRSGGPDEDDKKEPNIWSQHESQVPKFLLK